METFFIQKPDYQIYAKTINQFKADDLMATLVFLHDS